MATKPRTRPGRRPDKPVDGRTMGSRPRGVDGCHLFNVAYY